LDFRDMGAEHGRSDPLSDSQPSGGSHGARAFEGSYFGASVLGGLGFSFGPLVGGITLQLFGGPGTFAIMVLVTAAGGLFYWQSSRVPWS
jgi:hypothetical protein